MRGHFSDAKTQNNAPLSVSIALQRVVHGPAFGALRPADQLTGFASPK